MKAKKESPTTGAARQQQQHEDITFVAQMKVAYAAFSKKPSTMKMVSLVTGIDRSNICWYVAKWKNQDKITLVKKGICPISKHSGVGFYTTK